MDVNNEENLWASFKEGSEVAFAQVYNGYFKILFNYASKFSSDRELVKDCIHDLFIELWESRQNLSSTTSIKFYLFKAVRYAMLDKLKSQQKLVLDPDSASSDEFEFVLPHESLLISQQLTEERKQQVLTALNSLTVRQREAIFLKFYNDLTYEEIASVMALSVESSYNLIYRALNVLRQKLSLIKIFLSTLVLLSN